ncbi:MAG: energy-coupling factor ABC transporter permease [Desulfobacterales bacterium]|nr:energy-coupling factor ABC transporter permease [Desulfobacterales bacterium]
MHMADALVSPAVGGTMWAASAGLIGYCSQKVKKELDNGKVPLMGVLGAFIFAAQMINFSIPATGSSGHLGGGMILAILLGPYAAFLTIASVLTVQALFFADGGLLALGCNIFNLGFSPCFMAYPFIYKKIAGYRATRVRILTGALLASVLGLQLGSLGVVLQTVLSGITELPMNSFILLMQPIHLAIGLVEGIATAAVVLFIWKSRPEILENAAAAVPLGSLPLKNILVGILAATLFIGGAFSWFASTHPDGLEWSMAKTSGSEELKTPETGLHGSLSRIQQIFSFLPDYGFKNSAEPEPQGTTTLPAVDAGTSLSGLVGGALTLVMVMLIGFFIKKRKGQKLG